jgi:hypothetical protein
MAREHQEPHRDQVLTPSSRFGEPRTSDDPSKFGSDVVAALSLLTKMINQRLKFLAVWP